MSFNRKNRIIGWGIFGVSLFVYILTLEPTMSLWDCGEFILSSYKLEICHAPGAPLFMLIARFFSLFALGNTENVAGMINLVSAGSSAATVMFLFWTSVWMMNKIIKNSPVAVWIASAIGSLSFAFTDSFWFSAVEAEVYAMSSLLVAVVLWAATRWEQESDSLYAKRWLLLISFLTGLSIGVHLINLLVLPSIALIYAYKKWKPSIRNSIITIVLSCLAILFIMGVFVPGLFSLAGPIELLAVNSFGLPVNAGLYLYFFLLIGVFSGLLWWSNNKNKPELNFVILIFTFLTIGYTSYFTIFVRANADTPINQNDPSTTFSLINYLKRESYGTRPLFYGESFSSPAKSINERNSWVFDGEKYTPLRLNPKVNYYKGTTGFFPRMHSSEPYHIEAYKIWSGLKGKKVRYQNNNIVIVPTFAENMKFFLNYQFVYMFMRYFCWNFVGRQDDVQGSGGLFHGNWISGIPIVDELRLGPQKDMPFELQKNTGRNHYFFLPLIIGLIGLFFHLRKDRLNFIPFLFLFLIMSVGLVFYLNEVPNTPRERDYVYVGAFYVFSIWIGVGALAIYKYVGDKLTEKAALIVTVAVGICAGPGILLWQNFDDHDRSGRFSGRDAARNYLMSCEKDAILFTSGDNDTYPLWYCQEVEGIRQDVRIVVMPYLAANWYIPQLSKTIYNNQGIDFAIPIASYELVRYGYIPVIPKVSSKRNFKEILEFVSNDSSQTKIQDNNNQLLDYVPVKSTYIDFGSVELPVTFEDYLSMPDLAFWDIISSNVGKRPICFTSYANPARFGLEDYLRFDGHVYTLIPEKNESNGLLSAKVDIDLLYDNLMNRIDWSNLEDNSVNFDYHHRHMFNSMYIRYSYFRLADELLALNRKEDAANVVSKGIKTVSLKVLPVDYFSCLLNRLCFEVGENDLAEQFLKEQAKELERWINYLFSFDINDNKEITEELSQKYSLYKELTYIALQFSPAFGNEMKAKYWN